MQVGKRRKNKKEKEEKEKRDECMLGRVRDVRVATSSKQRVILLLYKEIYLTKEVTSSLLESVVSVLQEF